MIELRIQGQAVDVAPDTKITLNFNSNIFGDISKITPSNSLTITLPKTPKNAKVFGAPSVVGGSSIAPYRRWNAELYVNGVAMVDTAYAVLLSVGESYEIALYWGVVTALSTLKDNGKTLADINKVLEIKYGGTEWWNYWEGAYGKEVDGSISKDLINAVYEAGIENLRNNATARAQAALLPSVRASWIWDNIVADNGLSVNVPGAFRNWLERIAVPFVGCNTAPEDSFILEFTKANTKYYNPQDVGAVTFHSPNSKPISANYTIETKEVPVIVDMKATSTVITSNEEGVIRIAYNVSGAYRGDMQLMLLIEHRNDKHQVLNSAKQDVSKRKDGTFEVKRSFETQMLKDEYIIAYLEWFDYQYNNNFDGVTVAKASANVVARYEDETEQVMGGQITTRDNLPDISQLDFVKALCAMYGLWATLIDGVVHLVSFADLYEQTPLDWSHKLIGTGDGDAGKTTYTLADYAKRNILRYKEDDTVKVDASGALVVDNDNLDREKHMLTLPFSASDGNVIPHLKWKDDVTNGEVEEQKVEPRIMLLNEEGGSATLSFDGLRFSQLITEHYDFWQKIMRNPIVIEEKVRLSEIDIKMLDFRKPIYLQKYGALFAISKVQWSEGEASAITLVKLPPLQDIEVALPYKVTTGVSKTTIGLAPNPISKYESLVSGAGYYLEDSATLVFDEARAEAEYGIAFMEWISDSGRVLGRTNPFVYDGSNGDIVIYANVAEIF